MEFLVKNKIYLLLVCITCVLFCVAHAETLNNKDLKKISFNVFPDARPLSFINEKGEPDGLVTRLLQGIAEKNGFVVEYHFFSWSDALEAVREGTIDLVGGAVKSAKREQYFDFSKEDIITDWGQVYIPADSTVENLLDLEYKRIGVLTGDQNAVKFKAMTADFGLNCKYVEAETYTEIILLLEEKKIDAGVFLNTFWVKSDYIKPSTIVFNPVKSYFVTAKGTNAELMDAISETLAEWKNQDGSYYYQKVDDFLFSGVKEQEIIPSWVKILIVVIIGLSIFLIAMSMILKYLINVRTDELKASEDKFRRIVENMPVMMNALDEHGNIISLNYEFQKVLGYSKEEVYAAKNPLELFYPDPEYRATVLNVLSSGTGFRNREATMVCKDGSKKIISWSNISDKVPVPGWFTWGVGVDITELKKTEEALIKAKEKAEESDRLKTAFLAGISHEIRTPMNGILGFANLLQDKGISSDERIEYVSIIEKSGKRMLAIINDLIDISKIESGKMDLYIKETNINTLLEDLFSFFKPEALNKGLKFVCNTGLTKQESLVDVDKERIDQVVVNLLSNALKFTDKGEVVFGYEKKKDELVFYVKDTGIGIDKADHKVIFDRFRQSSSINSKRYGGSGLGLSISKAFVEMHGGRIWVESSLGEGAAFYFTLPYKCANDLRGGWRKDQRSEEKTLVRDNVKVLIAEDDVSSYCLLKKILEKHNISTLYACDGSKAVEMVESNPDINLILMDVQMPVMDGVEATKIIKRKHRHIPIIAQTAFVQTEDREKILEAGCDDFVAKPINITNLIDVISRNI